LLLEDWERPEDVLFDHVDDQVEVGNDDGGHAILVIEVVIEFLEVGLAIVLLLDLLGLVVEIEWGRANLQLL
jgi:hypothetical protein